MSRLEEIHDEVAAVEAKRAHSVLLENAARAIIAHAAGQVSSARLEASVSVPASGGAARRNVCVYLNCPLRSSVIKRFETLSECLRWCAAEFAPEAAAKGGE